MGWGRALFQRDAGGENDPIRLPGKPPVEVVVKRSARARRLSLRISKLDGRATVTLPVGVPRAEAAAFVAEKADWIRAHVASAPDEVVPMPGGSLMFEGREMPILTGPGRSVRVTEAGLIVPETRPETTPARLQAFLKVEARARLVTASEHYAGQIRRRVGRVTLRDTRSRWGSCSSEGNLMYSWRLVMAPPEVLDYVAAHEVAHLVHMDHSQAFWDQCAALYPDHRTARRWLKANGGLLHRYRFRD